MERRDIGNHQQRASKDRRQVSSIDVNDDEVFKNTGRYKYVGFRVKLTVVELIGSAVTVCGIWDAALVDVLVEFFRSEDWMARKTTAEALMVVARVGKSET
ncbi:hypothetical protein Droror1_Dr00007335 [Drosera rotundifolia]